MNDDSRGCLVAIVLAIVAVVVVGGVLLGGWWAHWWFYTQNLNRQYRANLGSQSFQAGIVSQLRDDAKAYYVSHDDGQKALIKGQFCTQYIDLNPPPQDLVQAQSTICNP